MEEDRQSLISGKILLTIIVTAIVCTAVFWCLFGKMIAAGRKFSKLQEIDEIVDEYFIGEYSYDDVLDSMAAGYIDGLGDQWSYYITKDEIEDYNNTASNSYVGIGVEVTKDVGEYMDVVRVEEGSGAFEAGIKAADKIIAVASVNIINLSLDDVTQLISGPEGTMIPLTVLRDGETFDVYAERRVLKTKTVEYSMIDKTAYIKIENFFEGSAENMIAAFEELTEKGAENVVFDVRFNSGGYLSELVDMLDYLLPEGVIFREEDIEGNESTIESDESHVDIPVAILVNDMTYSAAEYFAEAIREFDKGFVVGIPTTGKGYSQVFIPLSDGSGLNLSTMKYFTPNGDCLAGVGITPDIEVPVSDDEYVDLYYGELAADDDSQLVAAISKLAE